MADAVKTYALVSEKEWHDGLFHELESQTGGRWVRYRTKDEFTLEALEKTKPDLVFIPHWSYIIPASIYTQYNCVVFHMTDLPYGRGGSPLQNLIVRGHTETQISAIKVEAGIDTGPVYLKAPLLLEGTARDIFTRAAGVIKTMILEIVNKHPEPIEQSGEPVLFKRRKPEDSDISGLAETEKIYDYIRMLDAEGYPKAFLETEHFKFEFTQAEKGDNQTLSAHVRIIKK